jgi:hypothetical protein
MPSSRDLGSAGRPDKGVVGVSTQHRRVSFISKLIIMIVLVLIDCPYSSLFVLNSRPRVVIVGAALVGSRNASQLSD